jgi:DNA-binding transcriptional LysR family regulator
MGSLDLELLRSGATDLLVDWMPSIPRDIEAREVAQTEAFIVAPSGGPYAQKGNLQLGQLEDVPFISYREDRALKDLQFEVLKQHRVTPNEAFSADSSDTILGFVAAGLGFSLIPVLRGSVPRVAGVVAQKLERPVAVYPIHAAWKRRTRCHPLIEAALEVAPKLPP